MVNQTLASEFDLFDEKITILTQFLAPPPHLVYAQPLALDILILVYNVLLVQFHFLDRVIRESESLEVSL